MNSQPQFYLKSHSFWLILLAIFFFGNQIFGQTDGPKPRGIVPVFEKTRPSAPVDKNSGASPVRNKSKKPTYKRISSRLSSGKVSKTDRPGKRPVKSAQPDIPESRAEQIGITLWQINGNIPERVSIDTIFRPFDRVRLSVESSRRGFIYIINQELRADDTSGNARLIFPSKQVRNGANLIVPGKPIEIPNLNGSPFYFEFRPNNESSAIAEMLFVIITNQPIPGLEIGDQPGLISENTLNIWRTKWAGRTEIFESNGNQKTYTQKEREAAAGESTLTGDDPLPQTIFMIEANRNSGSLITVPLWYGGR